MGLERRLLLISPQPCDTALASEMSERQWQVVHVHELPAAAKLLRLQRFDVALLALGSGVGGAQHFEACRAAAPACEWVGIFSAGQSSEPPWRDHILAHFFDHHTSPASPAQLAHSLGQAYARALLRSTQADGDGPEQNAALGMVGHSAGLRRLRELVRKAGPTDVPVLIGGESGSGKELVAQALHRCSPRADSPFVVVNCGALAPTLIHSELFGHERGSFSGASAARRGLIELARGGTLFIDEIAEVPLDLQATLLRFLQDKTTMRVGGEQVTNADTRVIAASHVDLGQAAADGRFRQDLYFRLNVLELKVPALRERREDIGMLARHFLESCSRGLPGRVKGFTSAAVESMMKHDWPGNVRELHNRVQRAVVMADHGLIAPSDLGLDDTGPRQGEELHEIRERAEINAIRRTMERVNRNVTLAAGELGISRMTLYRLMAKHGITPESR